MAMCDEELVCVIKLLLSNPSQFVVSIITDNASLSPLPLLPTMFGMLFAFVCICSHEVLHGDDGVPDERRRL